MPLEPGKSRAVVGRNIEREVAAGKPRKQAIAIALKKAGLSNQTEGREVVHRRLRDIIASRPR